MDNSLIITTLADGATAELRRIAPLADREAARRISAELKRIAASLDRKYNFPGRERREKVAVIG